MEEMEQADIHTEVESQSTLSPPMATSSLSEVSVRTANVAPHPETTTYDVNTGLNADDEMGDASSLSAITETGHTATETLENHNILEPNVESVEMLMVDREHEINDEAEQALERDPLINSDGENAVEEDQEVVEIDDAVQEQEEGNQGYMHDMAFDIVLEMFDEDPAAAQSRRFNEIRNSESLADVPRVSFLGNQQLLQIRRALLVMERNRRLRSDRQFTSNSSLTVANGTEGSAQGEEDEELNEDGPQPETGSDSIPENPIRFDTNLAAEHSYLGADMSRVSGVEYLDVGEGYSMMLFLHQHIVYPGEVLPFMISGTILDADDSSSGMLFGVCFPFMRSERNENVFYGVTCQIYEKGTDKRGHTVVKSRALQRFITTRDTHIEDLEYINNNPRLNHGYVQILPEIYLPEPLNCIHMGNLNRFRDIASMERQFQRYQAATTTWPAHIYSYYNISSIVEKARKSLAQHEIDTMPTNPVQLSFWLARNLHLPEVLMKKIFMENTVNLRMKIIASTLEEESVFVCRACGNRIANCSELFAMSKHGVQTQYCNSAGYIHETNTVYKLLRDAVSYSGQRSSEFSWFPGYTWHIIVCKMCTRHIGWEFKAMEPNLVPKCFFGISSSCVRVSDSNGAQTNPREEIFRNFMRLSRREVQ